MAGIRFCRFLVAPLLLLLACLVASVLLIGPIGIGRDSVSAALHFDGLIDDLRIYDRAVSAAEIQGVIDNDADDDGVIDGVDVCSGSDDALGCPSSAWAVGTRGGILKSTDAGQSWGEKPSGTGADFTFTSVYFVDDQYGWAFGYSSGCGRFVYRTQDGGETWSEQIDRLYPAPLALAVDREIELRSRVGSDNALSVKSTQDEGKRPRAGLPIVSFS
jgi:hypothetical protein